jgi:NagD protein
MDKTLLIDIDGVLRIEGKPIEGAIETIEYLKENGIPFLFVSNGTRNSRDSVAKELADMGFNITGDAIFTAPLATAGYINSKKEGARIFMIAEGDTERDFEKEGIKVTRKEEPVDFVVLGYDRRYTYDTVSIAFRQILSGSGFIAMNIDKNFVRADGFFPAGGLLVKGLEFCTGKEATVIGKPNKTFFDMAMKVVGSTPDKTVMIGDLLEGDIIGAKKAGLEAIMVRTGSYDEGDVKASAIKPDMTLDSIRDLPGALKKRYLL